MSVGGPAKIIHALRAIERSGLLRVLARNEIRVYLLLLLSGKGATARLTARALCRKLHLSEQTVRQALTRLEARRLISVNRRPRQRGRLRVMLLPIRSRR